MLNLKPTLRGEDITLRPLGAQDFDEHFAAASDHMIWPQHLDQGRGARKGFPSFFEDALASKGRLIAIDVPRQSIIGWSRYSTYLPSERITIGYTFLTRSHWGGARLPERREYRYQYTSDTEEF